MSTKIYNGFKFKSTDIFEIFNELKRIRQECLPIYEHDCNQYVATRSVTLLDRYCYYKEKFGEKPAPIVDAYLEFVDRVKKVKSSSQRDPLADYEFGISIFPFNGEFYGMHFTEQKSFLKILQGSPLFIEYHYQNQTDPPEEISDEDWQLRKEIWENGIFKENTVPSNVSFTYSVVDSVHDIPAPDSLKVLSLIPPIKLRVSDLVTDLLFQDRVRTQKLEINSGNFVAEFRKYNEWLKTEEGNRAKDDWQEHIVKHLVLNVTINDLTGDA